MRTVIPFLVLALITSCRSNKEVVVDTTQQTDSIARSETHRTIVSIDSVFRNIDFKFDTLKVNIQRPVEYAEKPEVITLTALKGEVVDNRQLRHNQLEDYNRLDTVAYKQVSAEASTEHSATTRMYNPPDGTAVLIVLIVIVAILIVIFHRQRH